MTRSSESLRGRNSVVYIFRGRLQVSVLLWWGLWRLIDFISLIFREAYLRRCLCSALSMLAFFDWIIMNNVLSVEHFLSVEKKLALNVLNLIKL